MAGSSRERPRPITSSPLEAPRARLLCRAETDSAAVLGAFADVEGRADRARAYRRMADAENEHARRWAIRIYETSGAMPGRTPTVLARLLSALARRFGPTSVAPVVRRLQSWHHAIAARR